MNQILSVENIKEKKQKNKNNGPVEIKTIAKFFAIVTLIFGICMIGSGSYSMYKNSKERVLDEKPSISLIENENEDFVTLQASHSKGLSKVTYRWNDGEEVEIENCQGMKKIEEKIEILKGSNTLNITATDLDGRTTSTQRIYERESDIDIQIEAKEGKIQVTAEGKEELSYMTYRWDEEDEIKVEINDLKIEQMLEIPKGLHTLTIVVVDKNNQTTTKTQEVQGVEKPKVEVTTDGDYFMINASDDEGVNKVDFIINGTKKFRVNYADEKELEDRKQFYYEYPLDEGENKLEIRVYNEVGAETIKKVKFTKEN